MKKIIIGFAGLVIAGLSLTAYGSATMAPRPAVTVTDTVTAKPATAKTHSAKPKPVPAAAPAPTQAAALPTVETNWAIAPPQFAVKPSTIQTSRDGTQALTGITWSSWTADNAEGSGSINLDNGVPDMAQGTMVNVPVSIALSAPVNGNFTAITVTDSAGNQNTCTLGGNRTYWLGVDDPTPAAAPSPASGNSPAPGAPSCTTVNGYYPGGMAGHVAPSGECARRHEWQPVNQADIKPIIRCPAPVG